MNRLYQAADYGSSSSSETENELSSDDEDSPVGTAFGLKESDDGCNPQRKHKLQNIVLKLYNRERTGYFSDKISNRDKKVAFTRVPKRLNFCLKEIVPYCYLAGHVFMGLTACGQFMVSYKIISDEDATVNNYSFTSTYKYELYFWIYRPHNLLCKYFTVCLFDDHGVDNIRTVTMSQWKSNPRVLIVHGGGGPENEDSYITIVAVPNLGCLDCKKLRDECFSDMYEANRCGVLCIKCNMTIHTKYCRADSDPPFNPYVNLQCPGKILIVANGLIHMVYVDLHLSKPSKPSVTSIDVKYIRKDTKRNETADRLNEPNCSIARHNGVCVVKNSMKMDNIQENAVSNIVKTSKDKQVTKNQGNSDEQAPRLTQAKNIVETIIADFAECETDVVPSEKMATHVNSNNTYFNELVITCGTNANKPTNSVNAPSKVRLLNHRSNRIISRSIVSMKNGITKVDLNSNDMHNNDGGSQSLDNAAKAYEFSEDNEKCEKISTFRKRRLADKKYEFCEDNTENIIPYNKMRSVIRSPSLHQKFAKQSPAHSNCFSSSPPSNFDMSTSHHTHRASPSYGFRSPCGSPVGNRLMMMSPPARSCFGVRSPSCTRSSTMSPRSQTMKLLDNNTNIILSPRSDEYHTNFSYVQPLSEVKPPNVDVRNSQQNLADRLSSDANSKPMCSIKLIRRYVEEDDAASVITSEEDDCISPGYHTSLPLEVHGAGYSDMQMISKNSYKKLMCPTVIVTQLTFDLEAFTYYAVNYLCSINNKKYGFFFDCACEIVKICPLSCVITCILMVHFNASDLQPYSSTKSCVNCSSNLNLDCVFHRKHYECQILFTWDIESGEWNVLDYGTLLEVSPVLASGKNSSYIHRIVAKLAADMTSGLNAYSDIFNNLRVLDTCVGKSKKVLKDIDNSIEFYRTPGQFRYLSDVSDLD